MWRVYLRGRIVEVSYLPEVAGEPPWGGEIELHRGAPSVEDHPELRHAFLGIENPQIQREHLRHGWEWDVPDTYEGHANTGDLHRFLILRAVRGELGWTLVLKFPANAPMAVWARFCHAFNASPRSKGARAMSFGTPMGPDQTPKPASLSKGAVPKADPVPSATNEGIKSIVAPIGG